MIKNHRLHRRGRCQHRPVGYDARAVSKNRRAYTVGVLVGGNVWLFLREGCTAPHPSRLRRSTFSKEKALVRCLITPTV